MAKESSPAFQFYPREFEGDVNVQAMTLEERGAYGKLINICWFELRIPKDIDRLARILNITRRRMEKIWPALEPCFKQDRRKGWEDYLIHPRLEKERRKQRKYRKGQSKRGKAGADSRYGKTS